MKEGPTKGQRSEEELEWVKSERVHEAGVGVVNVVEGFGGCGGRGRALGGS
jgi:hypothetical protein